MSDTEIWECAGQLLALYGEDVGDVLTQCFYSVPQGDHAKRQAWMVVTERVQELYALPEPALRH